MTPTRPLFLVAETGGGHLATARAAAADCGGARSRTPETG